SAQIREILISESAWEEMTCLFAPSLGESGLWSDDAIERQLSHSERNNVRAAYIHTSEHLDERRLMVQWWADYLDANICVVVTPFDFAKKIKNCYE
ncbi:hypothetical protein PAG84_24865, partial [Klebsiella quasipneumoniae]|nr:hypothetical protein [Klebsiella quasipneumoniae]MDR4834923.1 hypothetical protein [Klebsiella quasipneumoniae]